MEIEQSLYSIKGLAILDNDGNRVIAKYYNNAFTTVKEEKAFEKGLFNKTRKANSEIILHDGMISVYRSNVDLFFYVMGGTDENELMLVNVLNCLYDVVNTILRKQVEKRALMDNMDTTLLAVDEICDQGVIMETDAVAVCERVMLRSDDYATQFSEQSVGQLGYQMIKSAREQFQWSLLK